MGSPTSRSSWSPAGCIRSRLPPRQRPGEGKGPSRGGPRTRGSGCRARPAAARDAFGGPTSPSRNRVWKDTLMLPSSATADILLELSDRGGWMLHRDIAEHLEAGMWSSFPRQGS
ncbi:MAG: multicopper oxidase domain-containing protein [Longimicrobiales bacterium]